MSDTLKPIRVEGTRGCWKYKGITMNHLTSLKGQHKFKWWVSVTPETRKFKTQREAVAFIDTIRNQNI